MEKYFIPIPNMQELFSVFPLTQQKPQCTRRKVTQKQGWKLSFKSSGFFVAFMSVSAFV
jgi:hypothetical protein